MTDYARHDLTPPGPALPSIGDATTADLAAVMDRLVPLAREIRIPLLSGELRASQYRRVADLARWLGDAADQLHVDLTGVLYAGEDDQDELQESDGLTPEQRRELILQAPMPKG